MKDPIRELKMTPRQVEAADALVKYGNSKLAGRELGISPRTIEYLMVSVKAKLNEPNQVRAAVAWDRLRRGQ